MIFNSDIRAWVSLLLAVAAWIEREGGVWEWRTKHIQIRTHCVLAKLLNDLLAKTRTSLAGTVKLSRLLLALCWEEYGTCVTVFDSYTYGDTTVVHTRLSTMLFQLFTRLTFQHFHSHFCAGPGMSETIRSCLNHPAKRSWSKSATWNTKKGSVGQGVNAAYGGLEREMRTSLF